MGVAGHHSHRDGSPTRFPRGDDVVNQLPVELPFLRFGVGPVEADVNHRAGKSGFTLRAALLAHPALARIGEEGVHFAELVADKVGVGSATDEGGEDKQRNQNRGVARGEYGFHGLVQGSARSTSSAVARSR